MQVVSVAVEGFRSLEDVVSLSVESPTLLSGHNDAGKSALLDALRFLLNDLTLQDRDRTYCSADTGDDDEPLVDESGNVRRVETTAVTGTFELSLAEMTELGMASPVLLRRIRRGAETVVYEIMTDVPTDERLCGYAGEKVAQLAVRAQELGLEVGTGKKPELLAALDAAAKVATPRRRDWEAAPAAALKLLPNVLAFTLTGSDDAEGAIRTALQARYKLLLDDDSRKNALSQIEDELRQALVDEATELTEHIRSHLPDLGSVSILPELNFSNSLKTTQVSIDAGGGGEDVRLSEAGAGRARQVALAVWEHTQNLLTAGGDVVLLYDEPDTHLDYGNQRRLMTVLRKQFELPNVRMVIATHSMNLIDGIDIANVVHVRHHKHRTVLDVLADDSQTGRHLGAIAASLGLRNTVLLHERLFVGVEGATEQAALPVLFKLATGRHLESAGIALWNCGNHEGAANFAEFLVTHKRQVGFIVDTDAIKLPKSPFSTDKLKARGIDPTTCELVGDNELEDTFSDEQWAQVANAEWPRNEGATWTPADVLALRSERKFSGALLNLFQAGSDVGPNSKPQLVTTLALTLRTPAEVPHTLRDIFARLLHRAAA